MKCPHNDDVLLACLGGEYLSIGKEVSLHIDACEVCGDRTAELAKLEVVANRYIKISTLGKGGMGEVWKVRDSHLGRVVALKLLHKELARSEWFRDRFKTECEVVSKLQHNNIVCLYEAGITPDDVPYFTMEYVEGSSLEEAIDKRRGIYAIDEATRLVQLLARIIGVAHNAGVVHRDLKPANILVATDGTVKITDFGISKNRESASNSTRAGDVLGSCRYMAPEQIEGSPDEHKPQTDIFALGVILYRLLTRMFPFEGSSDASIKQQIKSETPLPPSRANPLVTRDLEAVCLKCLAKAQGERYQTALELADDLDRVIALKPVKAYRPSRWHRGQLCLVRNKLTASLAVTVFIVLSIVGAVGWRSGWASSNKVARQHAAEVREVGRQHASEALDATAKHLSKGDLKSAWVTYNGAKGHFEACADDDGMTARVSLANRDLTTAEELSRLVRLSQTKCLHPHVASSLAKEFDAVFRAYGIDLQTAGQGEAKAAVERSHIRPSLAHAAEMWACTTNGAVETRETQAIRKRVTSLVSDLSGDTFVQTVKTAYFDGQMERLKSFATAPELPRLPTWLAIGVLRRLADGDEVEAASAFAKQVGRHKGDDAVLRSALGDFYRDLRPSQWTEAITHYRTAVDLDKANAKYRLNYGMALFDLGELEEAEQELRKASELDSDCDLAFQNLGVLLMHDGRLPDAVKAFEEAVRAEPGNTDAWIALGIARQDAGRFAEAVEAYASGEALARRQAIRPNYLSGRLDCERIARCQKNVPDIASGRVGWAEVTGNTGNSCLDLAFACGATGHAEKAYEIYEFYFENKQDNGLLPRVTYTYAAGTAVQASARAAGKDADKKRKQAFDWLSTALTLGPKDLRMTGVTTDDARRSHLTHALNYAPLAVTRKDSFRTTIPPDEAAKWRELWDEVYRLVGSPRAKPQIGGVGN